MSKQLNCEIIELKEDRIFLGLKKTMCETTMFKDAQKLAKDYATMKTRITHLCHPVHTALITFSKKDNGEFDCFMGDEVHSINKSEDPMQYIVLSKGTCMAKVKVRVGSQMTLSYRVAGIRKQFYTKWLKLHGYVSVSPFEDMELYHYRRRKFRKSTKMVMELYFFIQKKETKKNSQG